MRGLIPHGGCVATALVMMTAVRSQVYFGKSHAALIIPRSLPHEKHSWLLLAWLLPLQRLDCSYGVVPRRRSLQQLSSTIGGKTGPELSQP